VSVFLFKEFDMAVVSDGYELIVSFADNGGKPYAQRTYPLVVTLAADVPAVVTAMLVTITAATDAVIAAYRVAEVYIEDTLTLPAAGVQNENQAIITAPIIGNPRKSGTITIPAAKIGCFVNTSGKGANVVQTAAGIALNYARMFDSAHGDETYISDGEFIDSSQMSGKRRHTKNNNG
jgi:hypothetical protein